MASKAQIAANRANAQRSTGPKTPEGKAASRQNAVRHGLASSQLILFDERQEDFDRFHDDLRTAHGPADAVEDGLVERIVLASWRLRRVWRAEATAINQEALAIARHRARVAAQEMVAAELRLHPPGGKPMTREEVRTEAIEAVRALTDDEIQDMMTPEDSAEDADEGEDAPRGRTNALIWPARFGDLSRYEAALERTLSRATRDLERRQALRRQMAIAAARAAAEELALTRRAAELKATIARERAANDPAAERGAAPPAGPDFRPLTLAVLEANIEAAKRSQFPVPKRTNGATSGAETGA